MEADEYVEDGGVDWSGVAGAVVGSGAGVVALGIAEYYALVTDGATRTFSGVSTFVGNLVARPFGAGLSAWERIWNAYEAEMVGLGIWAFPVTMLVIAVVLITTMWGVTRFAR